MDWDLSLAVPVVQGQLSKLDCTILTSTSEPTEGDLPVGVEISSQSPKLSSLCTQNPYGAPATRTM